MRLALRSASCILIGAVLASCASGRSAEQLRGTAYGRMPVPPGSTLASEWYVASEFGIDGPNCAFLTREYASNDELAFVDAVLQIGRQRHAQYVFYKPPLVFDDDSALYSPDVSVDTVDGTSVSVDIYDVDDPDYHAPAWIDTKAWRFVVRVRIQDAYATERGGCKE